MKLRCEGDLTGHLGQQTMKPYAEYGHAAFASASFALRGLIVRPHSAALPANNCQHTAISSFGFFCCVLFGFLVIGAGVT